MHGSTRLTDSHVEALPPELAVLLAQSAGLAAAMDEEVRRRPLRDVVPPAELRTVAVGVEASQPGETEDGVGRTARHTSYIFSQSIFQIFLCFSW